MGIAPSNNVHLRDDGDEDNDDDVTDDGDDDDDNYNYTKKNKKQSQTISTSQLLHLLWLTNFLKVQCHIELK